MARRLTKRALTTYLPAIAATPGRPAYCTTVETTVIKYVKQSSLGRGGFTAADAGNQYVVSGGGTSGQPLRVDVYVPVEVPGTATVCYSAIPPNPGREAQQTTDARNGWNSGARSTDALVDNFLVTFNFPELVGGQVLCGIGPSGAVIGSFEGIEHAFFSDNGTIKVYESGRLVHDTGIATSAQPTMAIRRINGVVTYSVATYTVDSSVRSSGNKVLLASLFTAGDFVENPTIAPAYVGRSREGFLFEGGEDVVTVEDFRFGGSVSGYNNIVPHEPIVETAGVETIFDLAFAALSSTTYVDELHTTIPMAGRGSEDWIARMRAEMDGPNTQGYDQIAAPRARIDEFMVLGDDAKAPLIVYGAWADTLRVTDTFTVMVKSRGRYTDALAFDDSFSFSAILRGLLKSGLRMTDNVGSITDEMIQYATNLATGEVVRYSGFGFTDFCQVGMQSYGVRPDGLYELAGNTDDGKAISAAIKFAADNFGTMQRKRVSKMYMGLTTDGQVFVRLQADNGVERVYRAMRTSYLFKTKTGEKDSARFWNLTLEIVDASTAELDNIDWYVGATGRLQGD